MPYPTYEQIHDWFRSGFIGFEEAERLATERAQSERVGPSYYSILDEFYNINLVRDMATAGTIRTSNEAGPPITVQMFDDLTRRFSASQPESAPQAQGGRMRFSTKQTPLNDSEKARMKTFFTQILRDGKASYPLTSNRLILFSDGVGKFIYRDNRWSMTSEYVYIGYMSDEGTGDLSDPAARLALTVALMAMCDLQSDPGLLQLVEQRLAKILAGVYEGAIAPLAERTNGEPVSRIAWSTTGGVAAFVDGQWTSPVTGEAVAIGEGWVVVETGEGRKVAQSTSETIFSDSTFVWTEERFSQLIQLEGWTSVSRLPDGRSWEYYSPSPTGCQEEIVRLERAGYPGLILAQHEDGRWGITYPLAGMPTSSATNGREVMERFLESTGFFAETLPDGRRWAEYGGESNCRRRVAQAELDGFPGLVAEQNPRGEWGITYPILSSSAQEVELMPF